MLMKKLIVLAAVLCLVLAACGNEPKTQTATENQTTESTVITEETLLTEPEETVLEAPVEQLPTEEPKNPTWEADYRPDVDGNTKMVFTPSDDTVTAKDEVNLRSIPSQGEDSVILYTLKNGETVERLGISSYGWSELLWEGKVCYAVSSYLTTDLDYKPAAQIQTPFASADEWVTPKEAVNLRTLPSTKHPDVEVVVKLEKGDVVKRTGINADVGWSRVEWNGRTLYCISSYLRLAEAPAE